MPPKPSRILTITVPLVIGAGAYKTTRFLESRYPPLPTIQTTSSALRTPQNPAAQHCRDVEVYAARIPVKHLLPSQSSSAGENPTLLQLQEAWARSVVGSSILRLEGRLAGFSTTGKFNPGDVGDSSEGFSPDRKTGTPRKLLNGLVTVQRAPGLSPDGDRHGVLLSWELSPGPREFFEKIARWGCPWRLMSGGRHEMSVSGPFEDVSVNERNQGPYVEVRFSSAHDYEVVPEEGGLEMQKAIPKWTGRLQRLFARAVLDMAVRELRWADERREKGV